MKLLEMATKRHKEHKKFGRGAPNFDIRGLHNKRPFLRLLCLFVATSSALAQTAVPVDTLVMANGERRAGRIVSVDAQGFSVEVQIVAGQPAGTIRVPRAQVAAVEFAPDATRDALIARGTVAQLANVAALWQRFEPFVGIARSPAPRVGLRYGDLLLETGDAAQATKALALFSQVEKDAWNPDDRITARQGRLRGMVATGKTDEATAEAREIVKTSTSPEILTEAKYILAKASDELLRKLLEENPRWEEDDRVRPERARLYNDALDFYLYPSLFNGAVSEPAARGLWGAIGIYKLTGETPLALECARDIVELHAGTRYAKLAQDFLSTAVKENQTKERE
jgi:hypothetical protein